MPIALATIAQMLIMSVNDLDLSMGAFVSFVACVSATFLVDAPVLGVLILLGAVAVYAGLGVVIHLRNLPAIVVTLGMSFVWSGLAVLLLPAPGGSAPDWLRALMTAKPPFAPMAIVASALIAAGRASSGHALDAGGAHPGGRRQREDGRAGGHIGLVDTRRRLRSCGLFRGAVGDDACGACDLGGRKHRAALHACCRLPG